MPLLEHETRAGAPVSVGETTLIPLARATILRFPGGSGGLIWNRPVAVIAQTPGNEERNIPVPDVTRQAEWTLLGLGILGSFLIWLVMNRKSTTRPPEISQEKEK